MRVTVFGASGKVGRLVVKRLLQDGHEVVAFVHKSSAFKETDQLKIIRGDVHNIANVRQAVPDSKAVISTLGSWRTKSKDIVSSGIENILTTMSESKIRRVVSLTGSDTMASGDKSNVPDHLLHFCINLSPLHKILADGEKHIRLLEDSEADWTVLRSPVMSSRSDASRSSITNVKPKFWQTINRQSVANALVDLVEDKNYYYQAPYIKRDKA